MSCIFVLALHFGWLSKKRLDIVSRQYRHDRIVPQIIVVVELLFPNAKGERLTVHGVQYLLNKHRVTASKMCPSLKRKRVTNHRLRHTMAMDLLQAGVDCSVIALWLGHESVETTQIYLEATLAMKEKALAKTSPPRGRAGRFKPGDRLLTFLNGL